MKTAGILLAAGRSIRYGAENKLLAKFHGKQLVLHAASVLNSVEPEFLIAVTNSKEVGDLLRGFELVSTRNFGSAQSDSLRAGIAAARDHGAQRALIVLADMPMVSSQLLCNVLDTCTSARPSAATDGTRISPPACFPSSKFSDLLQTTGDKGGRNLIAALPKAALVETDAQTLIDIDTKYDLKRNLLDKY